MMIQTIKVSLIALAMSSVVMAEDISDEAIVEALKGITQMQELEFAPNRVISEEKIETPVKVKKVVKAHHKKPHKKYTKKHVKKHVKKYVKKAPKIDIMDLPMAQTLGVVEEKEFTANER